MDRVAELSIITHLFLMVGTMLFDLNKWLLIIVSSESIEIENLPERESMSKLQTVQKRVKLISSGLITLQTINALTWIGFIVAYIEYYSNTIQDMYFWVPIRSRFFFVTYSLFLIVYSVTFIFVHQNFKRYFAGYFEKEKFRLFAVWSCIIASICGRIIMQIVFVDQDLIRKIQESLALNTWLGPVIKGVSILIGSVTPIASLLYSLQHAIKF